MKSWLLVLGVSHKEHNIKYDHRLIWLSWGKRPTINKKIDQSIKDYISRGYEINQATVYTYDSDYPIPKPETN